MSAERGAISRPIPTRPKICRSLSGILNRGNQLPLYSRGENFLKKLCPRGFSCKNPRGHRHSATLCSAAWNGKTRRGQPKTRRSIPIAKGLMPYLGTAITLLETKNDLLTRTFKKICPDHTLKDLRHTFISRCLECKIQKELVDLWTDHVDKTDMTTAVYAHFSAEYQIEQMSLFCL